MVGVRLQSPGADEYSKIRAFIEDVKQHRVTARCKAQFHALCNDLSAQNIILGCTELPLLASDYDGDKRLWDPLDAVIQQIKNVIY